MRLWFKPSFFVFGNDLAGFGNRSLSVEREIRIDFRRHAARHDLGQFETEPQGKPVGDLACQMIAAPAPKNGLVQEVLIIVHPRGFEDQRWIGCRIDSPEAADGIHVARIGNNGCHGFQLIEF